MAKKKKSNLQQMNKRELVVERKNGILHIAIPENVPPVASKSGKTMLLASTGKAKPLDVFVGKQKVYLLVNAYYYPGEKSDEAQK